MKRHGFTLVELLAVLAILGLLALLITPMVFNTINHYRTDSYREQVAMIEAAADDWAIDHQQILPNNQGDVTFITLGDLKMEGYIDKNLRDARINRSIPNDSIIQIARIQNGYDIEYIDGSGTEDIDSNTKERGPVFTLTGDKVVRLSSGQTYTEPGVTATSQSGASVPVTVTYWAGTILITNNEIPSEPGIYRIQYQAVSDEVTNVISRTVVVK